MDADLQHDQTLLPDMLQILRRNDTDLVVASRYVGNGSADNFSCVRRHISHIANSLAQVLLKVELTDPMSGFFMVCRASVEQIGPKLSTQGFKILLDIVTTAHGALRVTELPYAFRPRQHGESKLDAAAALEYLGLLIVNLTNNAVPIRFLMFGLIGLTGLGIHMAALAIFGAVLNQPFRNLQIAATVVSIAWNFTLNNALTYRDQRLVGWSFLSGLLRFELICSVGAISNVGIATWIYNTNPQWWLAGLAGALMSAVWNYGVSAALVWHRR